MPTAGSGQLGFGVRLLVLLASLFYLASMMYSTPVSAQLRAQTSSVISSQENGSPQAVLIGVVWPFSVKSDLFREGVIMAVEQINAAGGLLGRKLEIVERDDRSSVNSGLAVAQSLVRLPNLTAVIGHYNSYIAVPAASVYDRAGIPFITPGATSPRLTRLGYERVFRLLPSDEQNARQLAQYAAEQGYRRIVIYYAPDEYGRGMANAFEDAAQSYNVQVVDRVSYFGDRIQMSGFALKWQAFGFDAVFVADVLPRAAIFVSALREVGIDVPVLGGDGLDSPDLWHLAGESAEGTVVASVFNPYSSDPLTVAFVTEFTQQFGMEPDPWAAVGFDAVHTVAEAVRRAGTSAPEAVAQELHAMSGWAGVTGAISFGPTGELMGRDSVLKVVQNGAFHFLTEAGDEPGE